MQFLDTVFQEDRKAIVHILQCSILKGDGSTKIHILIKTYNKISKHEIMNERQS